MSDGMTHDAVFGDGDPRGGDGYAALQDAVRRFDDALSGAAPPAGLLDDITAALTGLTGRLREHQVTEHARLDGMRPELPGRGHPLIPPYLVDERDHDGATLRGRVTFGRFHLGGGAAVHGGVPPLLFDDVLGLVANATAPFVARTVSLTVDFRALTPLDVELHWDARLDRVDGRKRYTVGTITDSDGRLLVEAHALFLELRRPA